MTKYTTISVPEHVKKRLEKAKGGDEWGKFLLDLHTETNRLKREKAFRELTETLTDEDLETIARSKKEFRERLSLR